MRDDSRQLRRDYTKNFASLSYVDSKQTLGAEGECDVISGRVEIVFAIRPRNYLVVLTVFTDFFETAVQVSDVRNAAHDSLTVQLEHEPQHTVCCGMLRPDIDQHVIGFELGLHRRRCGQLESAAGVVHNDWNALRSSLRVESVCRKLDFYCSIA